MLFELADIPLLAMLPALLVASGFFSGSETALFSLSAHQRLKLGRSRGMLATAVTTLLGETRSLLITLLLGNMTVNVLYFVVSTVLVMRLEDDGRLGAIGLTIASLVTLLTLILLGEITPKLIAARVPQRWSKVVALPLLAAHRVIGPLRIGLNMALITPLARLIAPQERPAELGPEELKALLNLSQDRGVIDPQEQAQLQQVLTLGQMKVRDVMTPRVDISAVDLDWPLQRRIEFIREHRFSRIPVCRHDLDDIVGVVIARQLLLTEPGDEEEFESIIRNVQFVPELQRADQLLVQFRKTGTTLAIAVDEYGGTAGLVTLEDLVERMVGDITGPREQSEAPDVQPLENDEYRVNADLPVRDWLDTFSPRGEAALFAPDVATLGGIVMARLGEVPEEGDEIDLGNLRITVETMDGARLLWLKVRLREGGDPA